MEIHVSAEEVMTDIIGLQAQTISELVKELKEARAWLDAACGLVRGEGPPNWDGIRDEIKRIDTLIADWKR